MASTIIKVPYLTPGLEYTVDVIDPATGSALQSDIALTLATDATGATGTGTVTAAVAQKAEYVIKHGSVIVDWRVRTIADDAGPYRILTGLDSAAGGSTPPLVSPSAGVDCATGWMVCHDQFCAPEDGVDITIQLTAGNGVAGVSLDTEKRIQTSATVNVNGTDIVGYVSFPGLPFGAKYSIVRGETDPAVVSFGTRSASTPGSFVVPTEFADPESPSFALPQILGQE